MRIVSNLNFYFKYCMQTDHNMLKAWPINKFFNQILEYNNSKVTPITVNVISD